MDTDFDLEKQLLPVRLSRRWMQVMVLCSLVPSILYLLLKSTLPAEDDRVWYLWSAALQSSGVVLTVLVAAMCFMYFRRVGEVSPPVIGVGLLCVGAMDLMQVLAGYKMGAGQHPLDEQSRQSLEMAFTVSRSVYAFALMAAAAFSPLRDRLTSEMARRRAMRTMFWGVIVFTVASLSLMVASYGGSSVQEWTYSSSFLRSAFLATPIVLFLLAGLYVLPVHFTWHGRVFGQVMILSTLPMLLSQVHLICDQQQAGSHFFMAVTLSLVGYAIPFVGLMVDYWKIYARLQNYYRVLQDRMLVFQQTRQVSERGNDLFKQLMHHTDRPILVLDSSHRVTRVNDVLAVDLGLSVGAKALPQLALTRPVAKVLGERVGEVLAPFFEKVDQERRAVLLDTPLPVEGVDHLRDLSWRLIPSFDTKKRIVAYLLVGSYGK